MPEPNIFPKGRGGREHVSLKCSFWCKPWFERYWVYLKYLSKEKKESWAYEPKYIQKAEAEENMAQGRWGFWCKPWFVRYWEHLRYLSKEKQQSLDIEWVGIRFETCLNRIYPWKAEAEENIHVLSEAFDTSHDSKGIEYIWAVRGEKRGPTVPVIKLICRHFLLEYRRSVVFFEGREKNKHRSLRCTFEKKKWVYLSRQSR